ncbi:MAG: trigger factor, partial [Acidimicrobiaceae bacterium]|nr:trigger factor [Acidimicrobiaceae bacterium]
MKAIVEPLEGNKVKLSVEVDEQEFEVALNAAFKKIAREVRIPGFRPGKAPRRLLEARMGTEAARQEALRDSLPDYYAQALKENEVDAIAPPEIDITSGEESGPLAFDAVVEVRPQLSVPGYAGLQVTVPSPLVTEDEIGAQIDRLRNTGAVLNEIDRPAQDGDFVTVDIRAEREGDDDPMLDTQDYSYEVGSGMIVPEVDENLRGAKPGDILQFPADLPGDDTGQASFRLLVKDVKEKVLPEITDEWAGEASEFDTVAELREDITKRMGLMKRLQSQMGLRNATVEALVELVAEDPPPALVDGELERRLHDLAHRLQQQGASIPQYLEATGQTQEQLLDEMREGAAESVKADLALRAVAEAEAIEVSDDEVDAEIERLAQRVGAKPAQLRKQLDRADQLPAVRSDVKKAKALEWLVEHVEVVDEEGHSIDRA